MFCIDSTEITDVRLELGADLDINADAIVVA